MLIIEQTSNGRTMVTLKKDWHPNRIGRAYQRPLPNFVVSKDAVDIQRAFLYNKQPRKQS